MLNIVILAAGKGTRMHSSKPKVLHALAGAPILSHVIHAAKQLNPDQIVVVYGFGGEAVPQAFADESITWVRQHEQKGTGHAVQQAVPYLAADSCTLILLGDVPLLDVATCQAMLASERLLTLLTYNKQDPTGYGRIVRDASGQPVAIVEHKDATETQRAIREINTGIMLVATNALKTWLAKIDCKNVQGEYYLTDIVGLAAGENTPIAAIKAQYEWQISGINSKSDLAHLERIYQQNAAQSLLQKGVTLADPARIEIRGNLIAGQDVEIDIGCIFEGNVELQDGVKIGAYCVIRDSRIASGTTIAPYSHIDQSTVGKDARIGPYARLRPGADLAQGTHIGNFVEIKNAVVGEGSKVNHLSYVGDATVGQGVNIGAGVITCNYDGVNKHRTVIGNHVFIGSDSQLVAPVTIEDGATIGAGSTITKDAPAGQLTLGRARQVTIVGWKRPEKIKKS